VGWTTGYGGLGLAIWGLDSTTVSPELRSTMDPLDSLEIRAKWLVGILVVVLSVLGILSVLAVIRIALG
jgi:hypothetical protein